MIIIAIIISVIILIGVLYYLFPPIQVIGDSMFPTYKDGEIIFGRRVYSKYFLKKGDVIVYISPDEEGRNVIKRIDEIRLDNRGHYIFYCLGDNPECSYDSRDYGFVPAKNLVCKVINQRSKISIESYDEGGNYNDEQ